MKKKIIYGLLLAVAMVTASSSFVSCKDYEGDNYAELREQNASLKAYLEAQIAAIKQCDCAGKWSTLYNTDLPQYLKTADLDDQVAALGYLKEADIVTVIGGNSTAIVNALTSALADKGYLTQQDLENYFNTHKPDMTGYATKADLDALRNYILLGDSVKNAYAWASYSYNRLLAQGDSLKIAYEQAMTNKDSIKILADSIDQVALDAYNNFQTAKTLADSAINLANKALDSIRIVDARVDTLNTKVSDLEEAMKAADEELQAQIDTLKDRVAATEKDINNLLGTLKKQISGIIIQATYSPVFGNGSLPLGIQTNILAAYAAKTAISNAYDFPSYGKANLADPEGHAIITGEDFDYVNDVLGQWPAVVNIPANELLVNDSEGNAGKMYLTVNPTNVDFSGTDFKLVNSKGEESKIQLSKLNASDEVLKFGWTRGTTVGEVSANGFYEVDATISKENALKMQPEVAKGQFKDAVKKALDGQKRLAAKEVAKALFNSLSPLQRYGVKAEWQDSVGKRSVTSAFDIAAFSIEPLGFGVRLPESKYTRLPVFDTEYLKNKFHIKGNIDPLVITVEDKETGKYHMWLEVLEMNLDPVLKEQYYDADGNPTYTYYGLNYYTDIIYGGQWDLMGHEIRTGYVYLDLTPMFEEMFGQINTSLSSVQDIIAQANKRIDYVVSWIERYNRYAKKANNLLENIGDLVQPVLIWTDGENVGELGGVVSANYAIGNIVPKGGTIALTATSYSLELFAPAYRKSLIVTNAYKINNKGVAMSAQGVHGALENAVKALNTEIKNQGFDIFSGASLSKQFLFTANPDWAGITFEIAYTAVDYEGKIAGRKFYITVGE